MNSIYNKGGSIILFNSDIDIVYAGQQVAKFPLKSVLPNLWIHSFMKSNISGR
jgi:hypothetical protein